MGFSANKVANDAGVVTDSNPLQVEMTGGGVLGYLSSGTISRPTNTTAYTAGDAIGINASGSAGSAIIEYSSIGPSGGSIIITGADIRIDVNAVPSGMTSYRLYLYNESPAAILDNAAWDFVSGDRGKLVGYIDLGAPVDLGATLYAQVTGVNLQVKLNTGSTSLYGVLVTNGAYTPASGTVHVVRLRSIAA